uniref:Thioredoxin domain-containing protein n=1 Tax=viral metagenome TaxID=1070528 RepID=A0A6C0LKX3_9ZZZZ
MANDNIGGKMLLLAFIIIILLIICNKSQLKSGFVGGGGSVLELNPSNYDNTVNGDYLIMVKFMAPWCGYCTKIEGPWKDLAKAYEGDDSVVIAEVNADMHKELASKANVGGYPTIMTYKNGKCLGKYQGERTVPSWKAHINANK